MSAIAVSKMTLYPQRSTSIGRKNYDAIKAPVMIIKRRFLRLTALGFCVRLSLSRLVPRDEGSAVTRSGQQRRSKMEYPLQEKIGDPSLLVGRSREFQNFGKWLRYIPKKLGKSRVILARRKSGKTAFVQRIFNQLWSENGAVIPFYAD
jgi:hypothetical protein